MQGAGNQFFAGAAVAGNQHGQIILRQARYGAVNLLHGRRTSDQWQVLVFVTACFANISLRARQLHRPRNHAGQFSQVKRFGQIFKRTALRRRNRGGQRVFGADNDNRQIWTQPPDAGNKIKGILIRHHDIRDNYITLAIAYPFPQ